MRILCTFSCALLLLVSLYNTVAAQSGEEFGQAVVTDAAGNVYSTGRLSDTADFDPGPGVFMLNSAGYGCYLSKLDASGAFVWAKIICSKTSSNTSYSSIALDGSGNIYVAGQFIGTADFDPSPATFALTSSGSNEDIFVAKLDATGDFQWARQIGGPSIDYPSDIAADAAGNVYTTGSFVGTVDFDPGAAVANLVGTGRCGFVSKLDAAGAYVWAHSLDGGGDVDASGIALDGSGAVISIGTFGGTADFNPDAPVANLIAQGGSDLYVWKLDAAGTYVWAKRFGSANPSPYERTTSLATDAAGNIYSSGLFAYTADFDPGPATFNLTAATGAGGTSGFISKLNAAGDFVWAIALSDTSNITSIAVHGTTIFAKGNYDDGTDLDPGPGVVTYSTSGGFQLVLDSAGHFVRVHQFGIVMFDAGNAMCTSPGGDPVMTGTFIGSPDMDPGPGVYNLATGFQYNEDAYIVKLSGSGSFVWARQLGNGLGSAGLDPALQTTKSWTLAPNPARNQVTLTGMGNGAATSIRLYNITGMKVGEWNPGTGKTFTLDVSGQAAGMYVVEVAQGVDVQRLRLGKQ